MKQDSILSMIGLATKAGKTVSGEFSVEKAVKKGRAVMVIVAKDASDNTKKMYTNMCLFYQVPLYFYADKITLGHAIGKQMRASLALTDIGFGSALEKKLQADNEHKVFNEHEFNEQKFNEQKFNEQKFNEQKFMEKVIPTSENGGRIDVKD